jgi:hypothetical protein
LGTANKKTSPTTGNDGGTCAFSGLRHGRADKEKTWKQLTNIPPPAYNEEEIARIKTENVWSAGI